MDSTGWHATRRAQRNSALYENPQRGPDGHYQPVEQVYPVHEAFVGGFNVNAEPTLRLHAPRPPQLTPDDQPPTPPSKDGVRYPVRGQLSNYNGQAGYFDHQMSQQESVKTTRTITHLSAVERSNYLRAARMNPYLQLMVGPLLRYDTVDAQGMWRGACLIVTSDASSFYEPHPTLTYEWDPQVPGMMSRTTSHVTGGGTSFELGPHPSDPYSTAPIPGQNGSSTHSRTTRTEHAPGHEIWVYEDTKGRTFTFWRFMIQIPLDQNEMCVKYTVNNGQPLEFFVPGRNENMRWAAYSCNGFSAGVNPDDFRGPGFNNGYDPVWTDLIQKHDESPFHALVGGGDQIYCDGLVREPEMQAWLNLPKPDMRIKYEITDEMRAAIDRFYFNHYCRIFQSGAFARATASIPMVNMADDHDIIDGFGSYPDDLQSCPVFSTIGSRGYFFFLLFQCFINVDVDGVNDAYGLHPYISVIIGQRGPYIPYPSHSFLTYLGPSCYMLLLDCRAERRKNQVCSTYEYRKVFERIGHLPPQVQHLVVQLGIPIAYPRMTFIETVLESKLNPLVAMGKRGSSKASGFVNKFNADAELLDDLLDHWTAKYHKAERNDFILRLQEFAQTTRTRITFLSGDVHCAAVGVFKTLVREKRQGDMSPSLDHRYMLNIITSAIVNTPPPNAVLSLVNNRASKTHQTLHHAETDETMLPIFIHDTDGSTGNSKVVMGRRNWCKVNWDPRSGELIFDIRVEEKKGYGKTIGYEIKAPAPQWN